MVTAKSDQTGQCLALLRWTGLLSIGVRRAAQEKVVTFFDLLQRIGVVISVGRCKDSTRSRKSTALRTYDVTGMSPQSMTLAQELNGFALSGTLYPPLNPTLREPLYSQPKVSTGLF